MKQCVILARRGERRLLAALAVAVAVAAMAPSARAELVNIGWDASGRFETETKVAPGKFAEVCGPLAKGHTVAWSFKADRPMNFNVHDHLGEQVVFPAKQDAAADRLVAHRLPDELAARGDRKSTRLNSSHLRLSRMPSSA